jgi:hypothetical protein
MQSLYLNSVQTKEIVKDIGANAVLVFTHYIAIAHQPNPYMEDSHLANITGLTTYTVKRNRLALTKFGWFKRIKGRHQGETQFTYLVGKEAVKQTHLAVLNTTTPKGKP